MAQIILTCCLAFWLTSMASLFVYFAQDKTQKAIDGQVCGVDYLQATELPKEQ